MAFPDDFVSTEPAPFGMFPRVQREMPSVIDRYFGVYRRKPDPEPRHIKDEA